MSAIHDAAIALMETSLVNAMITIPTALNAAMYDINGVLIPGNTPDDAVAGAVKQGPLQGSPDPDIARISVELYENDPEGGWDDTVMMIEIGGCITWRRRFTIQARCLLEGSREDLANAKRIGSTVRSRIEKTLLGIRFGSVVTDDGEIVTRGVASDQIRGNTFLSGGPPDAYDIHIKIRFEILTQTLEV
jgi:hypothetical protein